MYALVCLFSAECGSAVHSLPSAISACVCVCVCVFGGKGGLSESCITVVFCGGDMACVLIHPAIFRGERL